MGKKKSSMEGRVHNIHRLFAYFCSAFAFDKTPAPNFWLTRAIFRARQPDRDSPVVVLHMQQTASKLWNRRSPEQHGALMSDDVWSLSSDVASVNLLMCEAPEPRNNLTLTALTVFLIERRQKPAIGDRLAALHLISLPVLRCIYGLVLHLCVKCIWLSGLLITRAVVGRNSLLWKLKWNWSAAFGKWQLRLA